MSQEAVAQWLHSIGMERYVDAFVRHEIDWASAQALDHDLLKEIGIEAVGARLKILAALRNAAAASSTTTPSSSNTPASNDRPDAEHRQLTVMFCDLVGSTELSVRLDLEDYRELLAVYQSECAAAIKAVHGYIARYMGDGLLAYFGYPVAHEDDAERGLDAALSIVERLAKVSPIHGCGIEVRIGLATGIVVAGDIVGEGASEEHAILGETPSLAARLQALAGPSQILIASATHALAGARFVYEDAGQHVLKGFDTPVQAWRVLERARGRTRFEAHRRPERTALVGRALELELLLSRWRRACQSEGQIVALSGDAGIGKSRLVHALRERIDDEDFDLIQLQCSAHHRSSAFFPCIEYVARAARLDVEQPAATQRARLRGWLTHHRALDGPTLEDLLGMGSPDPQRSDTEHKQRFVDTLAQLVLTRSERQPVLTVVEDLQWADPSTLDVLTQLVDKLPDRALMLLVTYRPEFALPWRAGGHLTLQSLPRLARDDASELARSMAGATRLSDQVLDAIIARTDGVPLYVEELTRTVLLSAARHSGSQHASLPVSVPATLQDSLTARLDTLGKARRTAQLAATIGRDFSHALLLALTRNSDAELANSLDALISAGIIEHQGDPPDAGTVAATYTFTHALVRDAAYASLLRKDRQALHGQIANLLETRFETSARQLPEIVAHHFAEAGEADASLKWWWQAAELALQRSAFKERLAHLERAIAVARHQSTRSTQAQRLARLELARGGALMAVDGYKSERTAAAFEAARELAQKQSDQAILFAALRGLHGVHYARAKLDRALEAASACLAMAQADRNEEQLALAERLVGQTHFARGDLAIAMRHLERATTSKRRPSTVTSLTGGGHHLMAGVFKAHVMWLQGLPDSALALATQGLEQAQAQFGAFAVSTHAYFLCWILGWRGDFDALSALAGKVRALAFDHQLFGWVDEGGLMSHWPALAMAPPDEAAATALQLAQTIRTQDGITIAHQLGILASYIKTLEPQYAQALIDDALARGVNGEQWSQAELLREKADITTLMSGRPATAQFAAARNLARAQGALAWERRVSINEARALFEAGHIGAARALLSPLQPDWHEGHDTQDYKAFQRLLGKLAAAS